MRPRTLSRDEYDTIAMFEFSSFQAMLASQVTIPALIMLALALLIAATAASLSSRRATALPEHVRVEDPEYVLTRGERVGVRASIHGTHTVVRERIVAHGLAFECETWYAPTAALDRVTGPARRLWLIGPASRLLLLQEWFRDGELHCTSGPAAQVWAYINGRRRILHEQWAHYGAPHRVDGPAYQKWRLWDDRTHLVRRDWFRSGVYYRAPEPRHQEWIVHNGRRHAKYTAWF